MSTLVILRHGQSTWNRENRFAGWADVPLTDQGVAEATAAGHLMADIDFDIVFTSLQTRAISTANLALDEMGAGWLPVERHWRLNERHYGALQGLNKNETAELHGPEQVFAWRRGYATPPPALDVTDERHPSHDRRYASLAEDILPATECLADVVARMLPYWFDRIAPNLLAGRNVLVVAHGNSLRALVKYLEHVSDDDIADLNIPTGVPKMYTFNSDLQIVASDYIGDPDEIAAAAEAVARQAG